MSNRGDGDGDGDGDDSHGDEASEGRLASRAPVVALSWSSVASSHAPKSPGDDDDDDGPGEKTCKKAGLPAGETVPISRWPAARLSSCPPRGRERWNFP